MTETEQQPLPPSPQPADIAAGIAKDAQENLGGLDLVSVGPLFAEPRPGGGGVRYSVLVVVPERDWVRLR
jgi:hypothetical protein